MDQDDMFGDDEDYYGGAGGYPNYDNYGDDDGYDNNYAGYVDDSPTQRLFGESNLYNDYGFQPPLEEYTDIFIPKPFFDFESNKRSEKIKKFTTSEEIFMIITESNRVFRWEVGGQNVQELLIPGTGSESGGVSRDIFGAVKSGLVVDKKGFAVVERCFLDQKGTHCLLCTTKGENYYINRKTEKARLLRNFRERIRSAIIDEQSTDQLVKVACGTYEGKIYHFDIEVGKTEVNDLPPTLVTGNLKSPILHMEYFNYIQQDGMRETTQRAVFVLTSQYLYYFKGPKEFKSLFREYIGVDPNKYPGLPIMLNNRRHPLINFYIRRGIGNSIIVSDGNSMHYCKLPEKTLTTEFYPFAKMQTLKYAKKELSNDEREQMIISEAPIAMACSQYHYFILHKDSLTIMSTINESVVAYYEGKELCDTGEVKGMIVERGGDNIYVYDSNSIRTISFGREGQDVWELYLEKNKYQEAYDICKKNRLPSLKYVAGLYGDFLFKQDKYEQAIDKYVESSKSFEEICLKYINKDCMPFLEKYLQYTLNKDFVKRSKMRKAILASWVLEHRLHIVNEKDREIELSNLDRNAKETEKLRSSKPLRDFLAIGEKILHSDVTYSLLQGHGRFREFVSYAELKEKYEDIILHHLNEGQFDSALMGLEKLREKGEVLSKMDDSKNLDEEGGNRQKKSMIKSEKLPFDLIRDIIYSHGHVLMYEMPEATLQFLDKRDRSGERVVELDLTKLMPGFMKVPVSRRICVVEFLQDDCAKSGRCKDRSVHNLYIMFMSDLEDEVKLAEYLSTQEEALKTQEMKEGQEAREILFDTEFALKCFERNHLIRPQLKLYSMMGLYSNAVDLALNNNMIEEAKDIALKPEGETDEVLHLKKKLWLQIAFHLIHIQETEECMRLTRESEGFLQIEDLLPHFDDGFRIELFKDEISDSLKGYVETIKKQKNDLNVYEKTAEEIKNELRHLRSRHFDLKGDEKCQECSRSIFGEEFYLFPCRHCYHKECLRKKAKTLGMIQDRELYEIEDLDMEISRLQNLITMMQGGPGKSFLAQSNPSKTPISADLPGRTSSVSLSNMNISAPGVTGRRDTMPVPNGRTGSIMDSSFMAGPTSVVDLEKSIKEKKKRVDFLLASDCLSCGKYLVDTIPKGLAKNVRLRDEWDIKF